MSVTSPTSASPTLSVLEWDEAAVHSWLSHIGLNQYEQIIYGMSSQHIHSDRLSSDCKAQLMLMLADQGITGDVLAVMDHATLVDIGMTSVGHRLNVLRGVWELKKEQGIEFGEDDWRPQGELQCP
jgi:hypothetical protein